jgi:predicted Zn-dependent protease
MFKYFILLLIFYAMLTGCAVNPVTGKNELRLVPETTELNLGAEHYAPSRQMQGGDYSVDADLTAYVAGIGKRLAAVSDRGLPYEFKVINDSTPNAWALPGGKIAINRGLLVELKSEAELAAVLGHEIVHAAARHGAKGMERGMLMQGVVLATQIASANSEFANLAVGGAAAASQMIGQKYGRDAEREADYYGMKYMYKAGYDTQAAVSLQETFVRLSEGRNQDWLSGLFSSHPPSMERVLANRESLKEFPPGGDRGDERYRQKIAGLMKSREAYALHDQGRAALSKKQPAQALALAEKALAIEQREGLFHALRGDALFAQGRYREAEAGYNDALARNGDYFHFYAKRGLAREKLGQTDAARADLERSVKLLPTATALNSLGELTLARGDRTKAKEYFAAAAGSNSPEGKAAAGSLARLDLADNPHKYLKLELKRDASGYLVAEISNPTGQSVTAIRFQVQYADARGNRRQAEFDLPGTLDPGRGARVATGIGPLSDQAVQQGVRGAVVRAKIVE